MTKASPRASGLARIPIWVWAGLALAVVAFILMLVAPQSYPGGSSYEQSLRGYSSWYRFMQSQGYSIQRWQQPYDRLAGQGQTLIQVSDETDYSTYIGQGSTVSEWVEKGNTLVLLSWSGQVSGAPFRSDVPYGSGTLRLETTRRYSITRNQEASPELKDRFGSMVWSYSLGKGRVINAVTPWIAANAYGEQFENFAFLRDLALQQGGTIWVDEWLHGYRDLDAKAASKQSQQDIWSYLSNQSVAVLAGQGLLLFLLLLWGKNQRWGSLQSLAPPKQNSSEQYIQALAETLNAQGHHEYVLTLLGQRFREQLRSQLGYIAQDGAPLSNEDTAITHAWTTVTGRPSPELLELLEQTRQRTPMSEQALIAWVQRTETILRGLP